MIGEKNKTRVAVIDDHPLFREGVVQTLRSASRFEVVAEGGAADEAIHIATMLGPDVMLMDLMMPGGGLEATQIISEGFPDIKLVILTVSEDEDQVFAALEAGVSGYLVKGIGGSELIRMVEAVDRGEIVVSPSLAARLLTDVTRKRAGPADTTRPGPLTSREDQILRNVGEGMTNKEIARQLQISEKTVKHHMTTIMQKLNVRNRVEAARMRWENGVSAVVGEK